MNKTIEEIKKEINMAVKARAQNKEGLARVCARRAAGWAIQIKISDEDISLGTPSAYEYIKHYASLENIPPKTQEILTHLMRKVDKDSLEEDSYWPLPDVDLVEEACWLIEELLEITLEPNP